jgi:hypothetical protein
MLRMGLVVAVSLAATACTSSARPSRQLEPRAGLAAGTAEALPGLAALLPRGAAIFTSHLSPVSCSEPGDCTASGTVSYDIAGRPGPELAFVTDVRDGAWQPARLLPGLTDRAGDGPTSGIGGLSCSSPGNCTAVGDTVAKVATVRQVSDVHHQPGPEVVPEDQDVHADDDGHHREHVKHADCLIHAACAVTSQAAPGMVTPPGAA